MIPKTLENFARIGRTIGEIGKTCSDGMPCFNSEVALAFEAIQMARYNRLPRHEQVGTTQPLQRCQGLTRRGSELVCSLECRAVNRLYSNETDGDRRNKIMLVPAGEMVSGFRSTRSSLPSDES